MVFAGFGEVAAEFGAMDMDKLLTSFGFGLRFAVSTDPRMNIRVDYAHGEQEDALYVSIGEAF